MVGLLLKKPWRIKVLVNLTTQCQMGCVHCMQDAEPQGEHMTIETFSKVKMFIEKIYKHIKIIMLSGGEPTENPFLPDFISLLNNDWKVILLSNGLFLEQDSYLKNFILKTLQVRGNISKEISHKPIYVSGCLSIFPTPIKNVWI